MMLAFIDRQEDFVRSMFRDLFDEDKSLEGRTSRFVFYCDELLTEYKTANPLSVENNHYHDDDFGMVSLYLAFRYPNRYTLYDPGGFRELLIKLGSQDIPPGNDIERFAKLMRTLFKFLNRDPELDKLHRNRLDAQWHYTGESLLLVYDFYQFVKRPGTS